MNYLRRVLQNCRHFLSGLPCSGNAGLGFFRFDPLPKRQKSRKIFGFCGPLRRLLVVGIALKFEQSAVNPSGALVNPTQQVLISTRSLMLAEVYRTNGEATRKSELGQA